MAQQVRDFPLTPQQIQIDSPNLTSPQIAPNFPRQDYPYQQQINQPISQFNTNLSLNLNGYMAQTDQIFPQYQPTSHYLQSEINTNFQQNQHPKQYYIGNSIPNQTNSNYYINPQNTNTFNHFTHPVGPISALRQPQNVPQTQKPVDFNIDPSKQQQYKNQYHIPFSTSEKIPQINSPSRIFQIDDKAVKNHFPVSSLDPSVMINHNPQLIPNKQKSNNANNTNNVNNNNTNNVNNNNNINSQQSQTPPSQASPIDQRRLKIQEFKVYECTKRDKHEKKKCPYYHNQGDRRRCPENFHYSFNVCKKGEKCPLKDNCPQVHNKVEQLYHPLRYKAKFCESFKEDNSKCGYGNFCSFAHHENEIVIPMICKLPKDAIFYMYFYKTVWCPNTQKHERAYCPYMHNVQDFRRDPKSIQIEPKQCDQWKKTNIQKYSEGECPLQLKCKNCHGWKEYDYHPKFYKTQQCNTQNCQNQECVHYHSEQDRRIVTEELLKKEEKEANEKLKSLINPNITYTYRVKLGAPIDVFYSEQEEEMSNSNNGSNNSVNLNQSYQSNSNNNHNNSSNNHSKNVSNTDLNNNQNINQNQNGNNTQKNRYKSNTMNNQNNSYPQNRQQSNSQYGQPQQNHYNNNNQRNHDQGMNHQRIQNKKQQNFNQNYGNNTNSNNSNNHHHHKQQNNYGNNNFQNFGGMNNNQYNNNNNNNSYNNNNSNSINNFVDNYPKNSYQNSSNNNNNNIQQQNIIYNNNPNYLNNNQNNFNAYQPINYYPLSQNQSDQDQTSSNKSQSQSQSRGSSLEKNDFDKQTIMNEDRRSIQIYPQDIHFSYEPKSKQSELQKCFEKKFQKDLYETLQHNHYNDEKILELADNDKYQLPFLSDNQSNILKNIISYYNENEEQYRDIQKLVDY